MVAIVTLWHQTNVVERTTSLVERDWRTSLGLLAASTTYWTWGFVAEAISAIMFFFKTNDVMFNNDVLIFTTLISLIGSYLMVYSLYTRQLILNKNVIFHNLVFKYDIFLNFFLILLTFIICLVDINFIYFLFFFIFSMISLIVYKTMKFNIQNV